MRWRVFILWIAIAAVVALGSVYAIATANQLSEGLVVHVSRDAQTLDAPAKVTFSYRALSPLLCRATCSARLVREDTNETIATQRADSGEIAAHIATKSSLERVPIQLSVSCSTHATRVCQAQNASAASVTVVRFSLAPADAARRDALVANASAIEITLGTDLSTLDALGNLTGPYADIAARAREELPGYTERVQAFLTAIAHENYSAQEPARPDAVAAWNAELRAARELSNTSTAIARRLETWSRYEPTLGADAPGFANLTRAYRSAGPTPSAANATLDGIGTQLDRLDAYRTARTIAMARAANAETRAQLEAACRIYASACPAPVDNATTLTSAARESARWCSRASTFNLTAEKRAYAARLNLTLAEAMAKYNVTNLTSSPGFATREASILDRARTGPVNLTAQEALAINATVSARYCSADRFAPISMPVPELRTSDAQVTLTIPGPRSCAFGSCSLPRPPPVLFVHGHSFSAHTPPARSLESMSPLAFALERYGYLYAGHLFPDARAPNLTIDGPVSFTASYYTDSYVEKGRITVTPVKTGTIESYALRLNEDVNEALAITNSTKVVIVAHSMGGLVARSYLNIFGSDKVAALVLIGTPNHGISGRIEQLCPIVGAAPECRDMNNGSIFLRKLNAAPLPKIPITVVAGTGCDNHGDGVVTLESTLLAGANTTIVNGTCNGIDTLHSQLIRPHEHPAVLATIERTIAPGRP